MQAEVERLKEEWRQRKGRKARLEFEEKERQRQQKAMLKPLGNNLMA